MTTRRHDQKKHSDRVATDYSRFSLNDMDSELAKKYKKAAGDIHKFIDAAEVVIQLYSTIDKEFGREFISEMNGVVASRANKLDRQAGEAAYGKYIQHLDNICKDQDAVIREMISNGIEPANLQAIMNSPYRQYWEDRYNEVKEEDNNE